MGCSIRIRQFLKAIYAFIVKIDPVLGVISFFTALIASIIGWIGSDKLKPIFQKLRETFPFKQFTSILLILVVAIPLSIWLSSPKGKSWIRVVGRFLQAKRKIIFTAFLVTLAFALGFFLGIKFSKYVPPPEIFLPQTTTTPPTNTPTPIVTSTSTPTTTHTPTLTKTDTPVPPPTDTPVPPPTDTPVPPPTDTPVPPPTNTPVPPPTDTPVPPPTNTPVPPPTNTPVPPPTYTRAAP